jgi:hypothetical protein
MMVAIKKIKLENEEEGLKPSVQPSWVFASGPSPHSYVGRAGIPSTAIREISLLQELKHENVVT